jgi:nitronate monooxygenase
VSTADVSGYLRRLQAEALRYRVQLGPARWEDDDYSAKLDVLALSASP